MSDDKKLDDDYEYSREVYYDLIQKGQEGIEEMIELAKASEHPRAFEVLSGMIKNVSDVSDRLIQLNKTKKQIEQLNKTPALTDQSGGTTNNNIFIGSTTELQRFLQNEKEVIEHDSTD